MGAETSSTSRFVPTVSDYEIRQLIENHKNRNTKKNTNWAAGVFSSWRNAAGPEFVPEIQLMTVEQMEPLFEQICGGSTEERSRTLSPMGIMSSSVDKAPKHTKGAKRT